MLNGREMEMTDAKVARKARVVFCNGDWLTGSQRTHFPEPTVHSSRVSPYQPQLRLSC